jgi:hypothetical protein
MVGKSDMDRRCTKEELLLLKRLRPLPLHQEYAAFGAAVDRGRVAHDGAWLTDQEACDRALEHKKAGEFDAAEMLWTKVAMVYPAHGDCWFQLALLFEQRGDLPLAAVSAAHSVQLGCNYYAAEAERMKAAFPAALQVKERDGKRRPSLLFSRWLAPPSPAAEQQADDALDGEAVATNYCLQYFEADAAQALAKLDAWQRSRGEGVFGNALEYAMAAYPSFTSRTD